MNKTLRDNAEQFFDDFVEAFRSYNGAEIAKRYRVPYTAMSAQGELTSFARTVEVASYFQQVIDNYYSAGCRYCGYDDLDIVEIGQSCVLATVTWKLLDEDGQVQQSWRESYLMSIVNSQWKICTSIDH